MSVTSIFVSGTKDENRAEIVKNLNGGIPLNPNKTYSISLHSSSMVWGWSNISANKGNNKLKYDIGAGIVAITLNDGIYSIKDLSDLLPIQFTLTQRTYDSRVALIVAAGTNILYFDTETPTELLGFINGTYGPGIWTGPNRADVLGGVSSVVVHCDLVDASGSLTSGHLQGLTNILYVSNGFTLVLPGSTFEAVSPGSQYFVKASVGSYINSVKIWLTDQEGRYLDLPDGDVPADFHLLLKED